VADVAVTEVAHVMVEAVAAVIEETLAVHVKVADTEATLAAAHEMAADTKGSNPRDGGSRDARPPRGDGVPRSDKQRRA